MRAHVDSHSGGKQRIKRRNKKVILPRAKTFVLKIDVHTFAVLGLELINC